MQTLYAKLVDINETHTEDKTFFNLNVVTDLSVQTLSFLLENPTELAKIATLMKFTGVKNAEELENKIIRACFNDDNKLVALGAAFKNSFFELNDDILVLMNQNDLLASLELKKSSRR